MEENTNQNQILYKYPEKKYLDPNDKELDNLQISTNLALLELNPNAIKGVYLYGCDIEQEYHQSEDYNPVYVMRKARKIKCFQQEIKNNVSDYYISGLVLMGRPIDDIKKFKFYLKMKKYINLNLKEKKKIYMK